MPHLPLPRSAAARALVVLVAAACARGVAVSPPPGAPPPPPPPDGRTVVAAMHERWAGKWYMTLTFRQDVTIIAQSGRQTRQVWHHYLTLPGRLRIDYVPLSSRSGVLYADGAVYSFTNGRLQQTQPGWSPQLVLTGDVYAQLPDTTVMQLDSLGFDLRLARKDTWEGREAWVVGAAAGDSTSSQFWVDTDSLLVRRIIVRDASGTRPVVNETRYLGYRSVAGYPVAISSRSYRDGRLYVRGEAADVREGERLPVELFEPQHWVRSQVRR